ncbi:MAG: GAF domain-containing protein [Bdellovibrionales bacterium]|nr:GAF domain-containing protein [Bdellovibrionales bacterium]
MAIRQENTKASFSDSDNQSEGILYLSPDSIVAGTPVPLGAESAVVDPQVIEARSRWLADPQIGRTFKEQLSELAALVSNVTEAYTAAILVRLPGEDDLRVAGVQTLSRDFNYSAKISPGSGLIGWTLQNASRISVAPFEHDASTLVIYKRDQGLKSFVAIPITNSAGEVLGVISCDSKKNYAFAKLTEKILHDFGVQARSIIELHRALDRRKVVVRPDQNFLLMETLEKLYQSETEEELLSTSSQIPQEIVERDATITMTTSKNGVGTGSFYSAGNSHIENRLLELVCRHNKVICSERSVQAKSRDDDQQRSFLSVPFHVMGREAGSINLLSRPFRSFEPAQISVIERLAGAVGATLERLRLRDRFCNQAEPTGLLSWKHFAVKANLLLAEFRKRGANGALIRISIDCFTEIEDVAGVDTATAVINKIIRLLDQVKRQDGAACSLYGHHALLLVDAAHAEKIIHRLRTIMSRFSIEEFSNDPVLSGLRLGEIITSGIRTTIARSPQDGESVETLCARTLSDLSKQPTEATPNVRQWV